jgi:hypothetical protein
MGGRHRQRAAMAAVLACVMLALPSLGGAGLTRSGCAGPPGKGSRWAWPRDAEVTVNIAPDISPLTGARQAVEAAFANWQRAGGRSGHARGVRFVFTYSEDPPAGPGTFRVRMGRVKSGAQAKTLLVSEPEGLVSAVCVIDTRVTDPLALANAAAHEIGHTFGLAECDDCAPGASAMTRYSGDYNDTRTGRNGPSECDAGAVRALAEEAEPRRAGAGRTR